MKTGVNVSTEQILKDLLENRSLIAGDIVSLTQELNKKRNQRDHIDKAIRALGGKEFRVKKNNYVRKQFSSITEQILSTVRTLQPVPFRKVQEEVLKGIAKLDKGRKIGDYTILQTLSKLVREGRLSYEKVGNYRAYALPHMEDDNLRSPEMKGKLVTNEFLDTLRDPVLSVMKEKGAEKLMEITKAIKGSKVKVPNIMKEDLPKFIRWTLELLRKEKQIEIIRERNGARYLPIVTKEISKKLTVARKTAAKKRKKGPSKRSVLKAMNAKAK